MNSPFSLQTGVCLVVYVNIILRFALLVLSTYFGIQAFGSGGYIRTPSTTLHQNKVLWAGIICTNVVAYYAMLVVLWHQSSGPISPRGTLEKQPPKVALEGRVQLLLRRVHLW
jgi:hypothetical protein